MRFPPEREYPVVLDMALSVVAKGKIVHAMKSGTPIPETWGLNKYGEPTTDAKEAFEGLVQPVGGYKGYSMSFVMGVLGGCCPRQPSSRGNRLLRQHERPPECGALLPGHRHQGVHGPRGLQGKMDEAIEAMHSSELARGAERIYVPGEMEWLKREERLKNGIPVAPAIWKDLTKVSQDLGVALPTTI